MSKNIFTQAERHSLLYGLLELIPPWPAYYRGDPPDYLKGELHYYRAGRTLGFLLWIPIAKVIQLLFF